MQDSRNARHGSARSLALVSVLAGLVMISMPAGVAARTPCSELEGTTVRLIVPHGPGGGYDTYARLLQPFLEDALHARVRVENKSGAGGLIGAAAIRDAAPDGRTIGILNAAGLLAAGLEQEVPDPAVDYTIISRLLSNSTVMVTGKDSGIGSLDELLKVSESRPIIVGVRDTGSASIFIVPIVASLIGMDYELVTGYDGNAARALAAIRGEVDVLVQNLDSVQRFIADGELRPLLHVAGGTAAAASGPNSAMLVDVPVLGGKGGAAQRRAHATGRTNAEAIREAEELAALIDAGRLLVAPPALSPGTVHCLETAAGNVLTSPAFQVAAANARLTIEPANSATALANVRKASRSAALFAPLVRDAIRRAQQ